MNCRQSRDLSCATDVLYDRDLSGIIPSETCAHLHGVTVLRANLVSTGFGALPRSCDLNISLGVATWLLLGFKEPQSVEGYNGDFLKRWRDMKGATSHPCNEKCVGKRAKHEA